MAKHRMRLGLRSPTPWKLFLIIMFISMGMLLWNSSRFDKFNEFVEDFGGGFFGGLRTEQDLVDYIANFVDVRWGVKENIDTSCNLELTLVNKGNRAVRHTNWKIYFHFIRILEPLEDMVDDRYTRDVLLGNSGMRITHDSGLLYYIYPDQKTFTALHAGEALILPIHSSHFQLSKTDIFPNWYVVSPGAEPRIIANTYGETMSFVENFESPKQWKRSKEDKYNPYTAFDRYNLSKDTEDLKRPGKLIIPTPEVIALLSSKPLEFKPSEWCILKSERFSSEADFLSEKVGVKILPEKTRDKFIEFIEENPIFSDKNQETNEEGYELRIDAIQNKITITASTAHGIFNGIQSFLSLDSEESGMGKRNIPSVHVKDRPRFRYRGYMVDVSRNFHTKETIFQLLDVMAMYKMNKFHFHLTDDDGWRIDIPDIPELTQIGAKRCHDETETECLKPALGSGPMQNRLGSGYYTLNDYKEILRYAERRHIQVIPEVDMPSHMRAAMKSLLVRHKLSGNDADEYKMTDKEDGNNYRGPQGHNDNSANPCREGLYKFLNKIIQTFIEAHRGIQPLTLYHFGGDEVPKRALKDMKCTLKKSDVKRHFIERVVRNDKAGELSYGVWEDGLINNGIPYDLHSLTGGKSDMYAFVWTEHNKALFKVANAGYKVVNARGAYLYFDHPYEPDPEERGLYWATRYIDTRMVFQFNPMSGKEGYGTLEKPENIIGMQGQLWTELIRTKEQFDYMTFPRLLALAERAWHRSSWETSESKTEMNSDWKDFANTLSYKEFARLEKLGISYRLPPPGAILQDGKLVVRTIFPGLPVEYRTDMSPWTLVKGGETIMEPITLRTRSPGIGLNQIRYSREVKLQP